jgi:hypothetical protein
MDYAHIKRSTEGNDVFVIDLVIFTDLYQSIDFNVSELINTGYVSKY